MTVFHFLFTLNYFKILIENKSRVKSEMKIFLKCFEETIVNKKIPTNGGEIVIMNDVILIFI